MTAPVLEHTESSVISQADFHALLRDKVCLAVRLILNTEDIPAETTLHCFID